MTTQMATDFCPKVQWTGSSDELEIIESQFMTPEELDRQSFMTAGLFMDATMDVEYWGAQLNWPDQTDCKPLNLQPYPQTWYEAGLVSDKRKELEASWNNFTAEYAPSTIPQTFQPEKHNENSLFSQIATERALFMTPPATQMNLPNFPGSPISDPCDTPEMSHSIKWESDHDDKYSRSPQPTSELPQHGLLSNSNSGDYFTQAWRADDDESFATLEMPDGTTRRTSNWLPVDSSVGITIGTDSRAQYDPLHMEEFHDMKGAFFMNPAR